MVASSLIRFEEVRVLYTQVSKKWLQLSEKGLWRARSTMFLIDILFLDYIE